MGFFDDLGKKVSDAGQKTVQKTKEVSELARVNSLISQSESKINKLYTQIGKQYYSSHADDCEGEFQNMVDSIRKLEQQIEDYKIQIQDIRGIRCCEKCGAENAKEASFCSSCGAPMPKDVVVEVKTSPQLKCPGCGAVVEEGTRFCTSCGQAIPEPDVTVEVSEAETETSSEE